MAYTHPAALEAHRKYWTRHDAYRFAAPGTPEAKMPGWLDPSATRVRLKEAQEEEARAALDAELADLRASHERARQLLAEIKYELAWRRLCRKYGYNPISRATNWGDGLILEHQFGSLAGWDVGEGDSRQAFLTRRLHSTRVSLSLRHGRRTRFKEFNGLIRIGVPLVASGPG